MARRPKIDGFHFDGFDNPTTTPVPDMVVDVFLARLGEGELKALLYIIRRTFGFKRDREPISFNQFIRGITTRNGRTLDHGCGIRSRTTLNGALKSLEAKGIIKREKGVDEKGENITTVYSLRFKSTRQMVVQNSYPQQPVKQQTDVVVINALEKFKVEKEKAVALAAKYPPEYIEEKVAFLEWKIETRTRGRPVSDPAAWLIRAIEKDYQPPSSFGSRTRMEVEAEDPTQSETRTVVSGHFLSGSAPGRQSSGTGSHCQNGPTSTQGSTTGTPNSSSNARLFPRIHAHRSSVSMS